MRNTGILDEQLGFLQPSQIKVVSFSSTPYQLKVVFARRGTKSDFFLSHRLPKAYVTQDFSTHLILYPCVQSSSKSFMENSAFYVPGTVLDAGETMVRQILKLFYWITVHKKMLIEIAEYCRFYERWHFPWCVYNNWTTQTR